MTFSPLFRLACLSALVVVIPHAWADERRAPAPKFSEKELDGVFFEDLSRAFRGDRPTLSAIRKSSQSVVASANVNVGGGPDNANAGSDVWSGLISPASLEDEIKRVKLHYDSVVTTPAAFNGGGYLEARLDLTVLATMFAVITEHSGDVRWKDQAAAARDLLARTAFNCKAGSTQVYNEAKLRKADLQDLISGSGLSGREAEPENDWSMIADRSPLMRYSEAVFDSLKDASRNANSVKANGDQIRREAELISVFGEVLTKEGMDEADDDDYSKLSRDMVEASKAAVAALERGDTDAVRKSVAAIRQRCDACHNEYR
ncbi:MAG: cytochrome c [Pirellulales bacterium]|nr:cytochrome c [Pirellulales bacterium]